MKRSEVIDSIEHDITFYAESVTTVPPRYIIGKGENMWKIVLLYKNEEAMTVYFSSRYIPTLYDVISCIMSDCETLMNCGSVRKIAEEWGIEQNKTVEEWEEWRAETLRSLSIMRENRKNFIATFGMGFYRKLMHAKNDI